jgi:hypothetical protein
MVSAKRSASQYMTHTGSTDTVVEKAPFPCIFLDGDGEEPTNRL